MEPFWLLPYGLLSWSVIMGIAPPSQRRIVWRSCPREALLGVLVAFALGAALAQFTPGEALFHWRLFWTVAFGALVGLAIHWTLRYRETLEATRGQGPNIEVRIDRLVLETQVKPNDRRSRVLLVLSIANPRSIRAGVVQRFIFKLHQGFQIGESAFTGTTLREIPPTGNEEDARCWNRGQLVHGDSVVTVAPNDVVQKVFFGILSGPPIAKEELAVSYVQFQNQFFDTCNSTVPTKVCDARFEWSKD
jgi:hypothetical protein